MKVYFAALLAISCSGRVHADVPSALPPDDEDSTFELKRVFEVAGRQGIATNGTHFFNSASAGLYVYDLEGNLLYSNEDPFATGITGEVNHFGDISYHNGEILTGVEWFEDGRGENIQLVSYDPDTLEVARTSLWNEDSGQVEVSGLGYDPDNNFVWMTDWVKGNYIYAYDWESGDYKGKLHLRAVPEWQQGIAFYNGDFYVTADDGVADRKEADNIWKVNGDDLGNNATYVTHAMAFPGIDWGEIEGLDFDEDKCEMYVLSNRGRQIVLGMAKDYYPGYDREIHEVYVYRIKDCDAEQDQSSGSETEDDGSETEVEDTETTTPDETSGNGRILRTVGAVGAFVGGMLL